MSDSLSDSSLSQDTQLAKLATPLGKDKLCLVRFEGTEGMGELFEFRIDAVSSDSNIEFHKALGQTCSFRIETTDKVGRDYSGILTEARAIGFRHDLHSYRLVLRPWLWLMSLRYDCRIFTNMNVKDIVKEALGNGSFGPIDDLMHADYPTLEYTVQYRETALNFALRIMEKYGIYYYFKFEKGDGVSPSKHHLVLADSTPHEKLPAPTSLEYLPTQVASNYFLQRFEQWNRQQGVVAGIFELNDYDYNKPDKNLLTHEAHPTPPERSLVYDYPGGYDELELGDHLTKLRIEAERSLGDRCSAGGYAPSMTPGFTIQRTSQNGDQDGEYLILRSSFYYGEQSYQASLKRAEPGYTGDFELCRSDVPYRMPLRTRRPVIVGTQPAKVVSKDNQEIDVDELGRVLVEFYWDAGRGSNHPKKTRSRRVRVGQFWAGNNRGALFLPRIGDEVMVGYEDGDPDRPIIVGSVYNGKNTVPMKLPQKKTESGILTKSSPDGTGYNMLLFDDTKGDEHVKLRSQKDLMFKALNNEQRDILNSQTENIGQDETINVGYPIPPSPAPGSGNFTLNAFQTITLNVGPKEAPPLTQIKMDQTSITLNVGPEGLIAQIKMDPSGVTISGTPMSQLMVMPSGITTMTPTLFFGLGPAVFASQVTIPLATIGAGTVGPLPLI
jgi:type VI secretion system secreted protein VgrG